MVSKEQAKKSQDEAKKKNDEAKAKQDSQLSGSKQGRGDNRGYDYKSTDKSGYSVGADKGREFVEDPRGNRAYADQQNQQAQQIQQNQQAQQIKKESSNLSQANQQANIKFLEDNARAGDQKSIDELRKQGREIYTIKQGPYERSYIDGVPEDVAQQINEGYTDKQENYRNEYYVKDNFTEMISAKGESVQTNPLDEAKPVTRPYAGFTENVGFSDAGSTAKTFPNVKKTRVEDTSYDKLVQSVGYEKANEIIENRNKIIENNNLLIDQQNKKIETENQKIYQEQINWLKVGKESGFKEYKISRNGTSQKYSIENPNPLKNAQQGDSIKFVYSSEMKKEIRDNLAQRRDFTKFIFENKYKGVKVDNELIIADTPKSFSINLKNAQTNAVNPEVKLIRSQELKAIDRETFESTKNFIKEAKKQEFQKMTLITPSQRYSNDKGFLNEAKTIPVSGGLREIVINKPIEIRLVDDPERERRVATNVAQQSTPPIKATSEFMIGYERQLESKNDPLAQFSGSITKGLAQGAFGFLNLVRGAKVLQGDKVKESDFTYLGKTDPYQQGFGSVFSVGAQVLEEPPTNQTSTEIQPLEEKQLTPEQEKIKEKNKEWSTKDYYKNRQDTFESYKGAQISQSSKINEYRSKVKESWISAGIQLTKQPVSQTLGQGVGFFMNFGIGKSPIGKTALPLTRSGKDALGGSGSIVTSTSEYYFGLESKNIPFASKEIGGKWHLGTSDISKMQIEEFDVPASRGAGIGGYDINQARIFEKKVLPELEKQGIISHDDISHYFATKMYRLKPVEKTTPKEYAPLVYGESKDALGKRVEGRLPQNIEIDIEKSIGSSQNIGTSKLGNIFPVIRTSFFESTKGSQIRNRLKEIRHRQPNDIADIQTIGSDARGMKGGDFIMKMFNQKQIKKESGNVKKTLESGEIQIQRKLFEMQQKYGLIDINEKFKPNLKIKKVSDYNYKSKFSELDYFVEPKYVTARDGSGLNLETGKRGLPFFSLVRDITKSKTIHGTDVNSAKNIEQFGIDFKADNRGVGIFTSSSRKLVNRFANKKNNPAQVMFDVDKSKVLSFKDLTKEEQKALTLGVGKTKNYDKFQDRGIALAKERGFQAFDKPYKSNDPNAKIYELITWGEDVLTFDKRIPPSGYTVKQGTGVKINILGTKDEIPDALNLDSTLSFGKALTKKQFSQNLKEDKGIGKIFRKLKTKTFEYDIGSKSRALVDMQSEESLVSQGLSKQEALERLGGRKVMFGPASFTDKHIIDQYVGAIDQAKIATLRGATKEAKVNFLYAQSLKKYYSFLDWDKELLNYSPSSQKIPSQNNNFVSSVIGGAKQGTKFGFGAYTSSSNNDTYDINFVKLDKKVYGVKDNTKVPAFYNWQKPNTIFINTNFKNKKAIINSLPDLIKHEVIHGAIFKLEGKKASATIDNIFNNPKLASITGQKLAPSAKDGAVFEGNYQIYKYPESNQNNEDHSKSSKEFSPSSFLSFKSPKSSFTFSPSFTAKSIGSMLSIKSSSSIKSIASKGSTKSIASIGSTQSIFSTKSPSIKSLFSIKSPPSPKYSSPKSPPSPKYPSPKSPPSPKYPSPKSPPSPKYPSPKSPPSPKYPSPKSPPSPKYPSPKSPPSPFYPRPPTNPPLILPKLGGNFGPKKNYFDKRKPAITFRWTVNNPIFKKFSIKEGKSGKTIEW